MVLVYRTPNGGKTQPQSGQDRLRAILDAVDYAPLLSFFEAHRHNARPGYPPAAMFRAFLASYALNMGSMNDMVRRLRADPKLARLCGFRVGLPHRSTFNRFAAVLAGHPGVVERCFVGVTGALREYLPNLGQRVAVASTAVEAYGNPRNRRKGDPEAEWGVKHSARARAGDVEYFYGYKLHAAVDADTGMLLSMVVTPGNRNDYPELPVVLDRARLLHPWLRVGAVIADRGYDGASNFEYVYKAGADPVILTRRVAGGRLRAGIYNHQGTPVCVGMQLMEYVGSDPERGHLFRCTGCHLAGRPGHSNCRDEVWEHPSHNLRLGAAIRMQSAEWKALYAKRQSVERTFKSMKQSLRLNRHGYRGLPKVRLHCLMAALVYQATALAHMAAGEAAHLRWMVAQVA